jgi:hypothetical protein
LLLDTLVISDARAKLTARGARLSRSLDTGESPLTAAVTASNVFIL